MPLPLFQDSLAGRRRSALPVLYVAALFAACAISLVGTFPSFRVLLSALAIGSAGVAVVFLLRFLRANDERERQINYQALTFAFTGH